MKQTTRTIDAMPLSQPLKKNSNVLWTVSLVYDQNPLNQTKAEFAEMAKDLRETVNIEQLTVCLSDQLQRFRLMIQYGISEQEALKGCESLANTWYQDNAVEIEKLKVDKKMTVLTWQEFLSWPDLAQTISDLEKWYREEREFRNLIDGRVRQARECMPIDSKISNPIEQTALLKNYLFEECAFQKFAATKGFHYEVYKTQFNKAMRKVKYNHDFVPPGIMVETYFTQFPTPKKTNEPVFNKNDTVTDHPNGFEPVFSKVNTNSPLSNGVSKPTYQRNVKSSAQKISEFIEKTIELVPSENQDKAVELLMAFTAEKIIPFCYNANAPKHN